jgi:hypothetical protein
MEDKIKLQPETIEQLRNLTDAIEHTVTKESDIEFQELIDYNTTTKLTNSPHEIVFDITASVFEENLKGEIVGTKEICTKKFHIPVPIDKDYELFMKTFFEHLEKCILTSTQVAYEDNNG